MPPLVPLLQHDKAAYRAWMDKPLAAQNGYLKTHQFTHPASWSARLSAQSSTDHERHFMKSTSHFPAREPGSSPGSRRTPSQGVQGGGPSNRVLTLRFRKAARDGFAFGRGCYVWRRALHQPRSHCQQSRGLRIGIGDDSATSSKSLSPVTKASDWASTAEASTHASSSSRIFRSSVAPGFGTIV